MLFAEREFPRALIRKDLISMNIYSIYLIINLTNNKKYIGWTSRDPYKRFKEHQKINTTKNQYRSLISIAIEKYGLDNFKFIILYQTLDIEHSKQLENFFISEYKSLTEHWGYNIDLGGNGHKRSSSTIEKHRQKMLGRKQSDEHKRKKADAVSGDKNGMYGRHNDHPWLNRKHTEESKKKMSDANKGNSYRVGCINSEETNRKISESQKHRLLENTKYINVVIKEPNGTIINIGSDYCQYFKKHKLNNFMYKQIKDNTKPIKGYFLISYDIR